MEYPDLYPVTLEGEGVLLRELTPADAAAAFVWAGDPEWFRYMASDVMASVAQEEEFLREVDAKARARPRRQYILGMVEPATTTLVGIVRVGIITPDHCEGDLGYGLRRDRWGRGLATAAAALMVDFAFRELHLHRVFAYHEPLNLASRRVLEKLGMTQEGTLRENIRAHDAWRDSAVWSVLEHEWRAVH